MKQISIIISGEANSGKTTIAHELAYFLSDVVGFRQVTAETEDVPEESFKDFRRKQAECLATLKDTVEIVISEKEENQWQG